MPVATDLMIKTCRTPGWADMTVLETQRLTLRELCAEDAGFILQLVNEPAWLRFIGDKGIRSVEAARDYILKGPVEMYARLGFGLWLVELKNGRIPIGICGLLKRESLEDIDIGYAFLSTHWKQGYAFESASAVLSYGKQKCSLTRIVAVMSQGNEASQRLLMKLGLRFERMIRLSADAPEIELYAANI
jgi:RimJ/RimL family protein N-acetyltransferase